MSAISMILADDVFPSRMEFSERTPIDPPARKLARKKMQRDGRAVAIRAIRLT